MGLFNKNKYNMKEQLKKNVAANLGSCRTCRYYDRSRQVCLNRSSGVTYTNESQPKCKCYQLNL